MIKKNKKSLKGIIKIQSNGFAIISNESYLDSNVFIDKKEINGAFDGDLVKFNIIRDFKSVQSRGRIIEVLKRAKNRFIGFVVKDNNFSRVIIDSNQSKKIVLENQNIDLTDHDVVEIIIYDWGKGKSVAYAKLLRLICKGHYKDSDYLFITNKYGIIKNDNKIKDYSHYKNIMSKGLKNRKNLENILTFTIDPSAAKDFDDALSIEKIETGYRIYVHIADVSEFVDEGSKIDEIAMQQGNSYYFQESTIHMLPALLSEKFCSLNQNEKRLAISVIIDIDIEGRVLSSKINETCIKVDKKFTYKEADEIITKKEPGDLNKKLILFDEISKILKSKRLEKKGFQLSSTKINCEIDNIGKVVNIKNEKVFRSNRIIEEFMLLANKSVVNICGENIKIFRNHNKPSHHSEIIIRDLVSDFGIFSDNKMYKLDNGIQKLIDSLNSKIKRKVYSLFILKKLKKARYDTFSYGHFGLGFEKYTHFTSPIRRYPDLLIHRSVKAWMRGEKKELCERDEKAIGLANEAELRSKNAQKDYHKIKGLRWLYDNSKKILDGIFIEFQKQKVIIGISNAIEIQGEISINNFPKDNYTTLSNNIGFKGREKSKLYRLGDKCRVKVEKVDFEKMRAYFKFSLL